MPHRLQDCIRDPLPTIQVHSHLNSDNGMFGTVFNFQYLTEATNAFLSHQLALQCAERDHNRPPEASMTRLNRLGLVFTHDGANSMAAFFQVANHSRISRRSYLRALAIANPRW